MKKIIVLLFASFFSYSSVNAADFKMPEFNLPDIDLNGTIGIGVTSNLGHASGTEDQDDNRQDPGKVRESGVFVDDAVGIFAELNFGDRISVGVSYLAEDVQTPQAENVKNGSTNSVKAAFSDITTTYVRLNVIGGFYLKAGIVDGDILTQEKVTTSSQSAASNIKDQDLSGETMGVGHVYEHDNGLQLRTELMFADYDTFKATDTTGDVYTVDKLEHLQASVWIAKAF